MSAPKNILPSWPSYLDISRKIAARKVYTTRAFEVVVVVVRNFLARTQFYTFCIIIGTLTSLSLVLACLDQIWNCNMSKKMRRRRMEGGRENVL